jgi:hypothetical protein
LGKTVGEGCVGKTAFYRVWQSLVSPKTRVFGAFGVKITERLLWRLIPTELPLSWNARF